MIDSQKEIYEKYVESIISNIKDYIRGTKGDDYNEYPHWRDMLEMVETFRVDILSIIEEIK